MPEGRTERALADLLSRGLLRQEGTVWRTTPRMQAAIARAAARLVRAGDEGDDLRVPLASALLEQVGLDASADAITDMVRVLLPIQAAELEPRVRGARPDPVERDDVDERP